jgi:hypothetical protein
LRERFIAYCQGLPPYLASRLAPLLREWLKKATTAPAAAVESAASGSDPMPPEEPSVSA